MEDYCEVFQKRSSLVMYIIASLVIMTFGFLYFKNADILAEQCNVVGRFCVDDPIFYYLLGRGILTYFGLCIVVFISMLIKPYKLFYLNDKGFWSKNYGFIEWDNVADIHTNNIANETVISFSLKDESALKVPLMTRLFRLFNKGETYIELYGDYNQVNEIFKVMKSYCPDN